MGGGDVSVDVAKSNLIVETSFDIIRVAKSNLIVEVAFNIITVAKSNMLMEYDASTPGPGGGRRRFIIT